MAHTPRSSRSLGPVAAGVAALLLGGCSHDPAAADRGLASVRTDAQGGSRTIPASVGQELVVTLQTIGPGEFTSPPSVSSPSVRFLGVAYAEVVVPAGPTQRFRFAAVARGRAVVTFRHTQQSRVVEDTIDVR